MTQKVILPEQIAMNNEDTLFKAIGQALSNGWDWFQDERRKAQQGLRPPVPYVPYEAMLRNYLQNSEQNAPVQNSGEGSTPSDAVTDRLPISAHTNPVQYGSAMGYYDEEPEQLENAKAAAVVNALANTTTAQNASAKATTQKGGEIKQSVPVKGGTKLKTATKTAKPEAVVKTAPVPVTSQTPTTFVDGYATRQIPHGEFTHYNPVSNVRINPVAVNGDNGGLQHVAMDALYKPQNAPMSLGEMIAFASIMQGKKTFGGINDITATMQDADKMHAYAAQAQVGDQVRNLIAQGRTPEEARYEALSSYLSAQGNDRAAISVANPEFQKFADQRAGRTLDVLAGIGGDYTATPNSLGYTPYGINNFSVGDGTMTVNGRTTTGIIPEAVQGAVYAAVTGKGDGALKQREYDQSRLKDQWEMEKAIAELELGGKKGGAANYDAIDPYTKAYLTELGRRKAAAEVGAMNQTGVDLSGVNAAVGY